MRVLIFRVFRRYLCPQLAYKIPAFMKDFSYITSSHPEFIENLYQDFVKILIVLIRN